MKWSPLLVPGVIVGAYLLLSDGPVFWLALSSIKSRQDLFTLPPKLFFHPVWTGYQAVFGVGAASTTAIAVGLYSSLLTSILISVLGTFFAVVLGTLAGYATSRFRFVGHGDLLFFVLSTRMIPPVAVLVFYLVMYSKLGLIDTKVGLVLVTTFINLGLATWIMKGFFDGVPAEVENIALVNGYSRLYAFRRLVLPMVRGGDRRNGGFLFHLRVERVLFRVDPRDDILETASGQNFRGDGRDRHGMDTDLRGRRRARRSRRDLLLPHPEISADRHDLRRARKDGAMTTISAGRENGDSPDRSLPSRAALDAP